MNVDDMPGREEPPDHRAAHVAEPDEAELRHRSVESGVEPRRANPGGAAHLVLIARSPAGADGSTDLPRTVLDQDGARLGEEATAGRGGEAREEDRVRLRALE